MLLLLLACHPNKPPMPDGAPGRPPRDPAHAQHGPGAPPSAPGAAAPGGAPTAGGPPVPATPALTTPAMAATAGSTVTVYLSTGTNEPTSRCDSTENTNCDLYAVQLDLGSATARRVDKLATAGSLNGQPSGISEATLSPSEDRLVWLERNHQESRLVGMELSGRQTHTLVDTTALRSEGDGRGRTEWPEFVNDHLLVFDASTGGDQQLELKTVYSVDISDFARPGQPTRRLGQLGQDGVTLGLQDSAVWRGAGPPRLVAFGPNPTSAGMQLAPRVETLGNDGAPGADVRTFNLGTNQSGAPITECHHPAWSYAGSSILCMVHQPVELIDGMMTRLLYSYTADAKGDWGNPKRTFEPVRLDKIGTDSAPLFAGGNFERESYKYAQWCGNDQYVVATVFSSSKSQTRRGDTAGP